MNRSPHQYHLLLGRGYLAMPTPRGWVAIEGEKELAFSSYCGHLYNLLMHRILTSLAVCIVLAGLR